MVHVFKVALFLVILLFTLALTGFSIIDFDNRSDSSYNSETNIVDGDLETSDIDSILETDALGVLPKRGVSGEVRQDPLCGNADFETEEILAPKHIWEEMKSKASDCSNFGTVINCKSSGLGGCKTIERIPVTIVGHTAPTDDTVFNVLLDAMSLTYTLTDDLFDKMAEDGTTEIMIETST